MNWRLVQVEIGRPSFDSLHIPVARPQIEVIAETMLAGGEELKFCAVTVGNPHCVILLDDPYGRADCQIVRREDEIEGINYAKIDPK